MMKINNAVCVSKGDRTIIPPIDIFRLGNCSVVWTNYPPTVVPDDATAVLCVGWHYTAEVAINVLCWGVGLTSGAGAFTRHLAMVVDLSVMSVCPVACSLMATPLYVALHCGVLPITYLEPCR